MRIAQIAPPWIAVPPENYGGTETVIYHLIEELVKLGHDVTLLAPSDAQSSAQVVSFIPRSLIAEGVPWHTSLKAYYHLHKSFEYVTENKFDVVHTHLSSSGDMYIFPLAATLKIPHITTLHSHFPFDKGPEQWVGDADLHYMEWSQHMKFVAISESASKQQQVPITFIGTVHHGIPIEHYTLAAQEIGDAFVWIGRINPSKGAHLAIEAARQANVPLILAGLKEHSNSESMSYYRHMIEPYLDGKQIRFIGPVDHQQKVALLTKARGFLNPIEWEEPFGMVMIEAMATGCPVISFHRGAAPEIIAPGKTGFLVQNVDEMVQKIAEIDRLDRDEIRKYTEQTFSARAMAERYVEIYQQVQAPLKPPLMRATEPLPQLSLRGHKKVINIITA